MDKFIEMFANKTGLKKVNEFDYYGIYRGYELNFFFVPGLARYPYRILISTRLDQAKAEQLVSILIKTKPEGSHYQAGEVGLTVLVKPSNAEKASLLLPLALDCAVDALIESSCPNADYSPYSGIRMTEDNSRIAKAGNLEIRLTNDDIEAYNKLIELSENIQKAKTRESVPPIGAFFGGLLGAVLGALLELGALYLFSFSGIAAFIGLSLSTLFYRLFKGKPGVYMLVLCSLLTAIGCYAACLFVYFQSAIVSFPEYNGFDAIREAFATPRYLAGFLMEIISIAVFLGLGIFINIFRMRKARFKAQYLE
ncbi:MAG: hypothetical protein II467_05385 [Bacilli bacterium]|nr:hypothetical protein [Bacilli bacterium]MBQ4255077.1 hypothetical protein [Bacilli bacterium]